MRLRRSLLRNDCRSGTYPCRLDLRRCDAERRSVVRVFAALLYVPALARPTLLDRRLDIGVQPRELEVGPLVGRRAVPHVAVERDRFTVFGIVDESYEFAVVSTREGGAVSERLPRTLGVTVVRPATRIGHPVE